MLWGKFREERLPSFFQLQVLFWKSSCIFKMVALFSFSPPILITKTFFFSLVCYHLCYPHFALRVLNYSSLPVTLIMSQSLWIFQLLCFLPYQIQASVSPFQSPLSFLFLFPFFSPFFFLPWLFICLVSFTASGSVLYAQLPTWHHLPSFKTSLRLTPVLVPGSNQLANDGLV